MCIGEGSKCIVQECTTEYVTDMMASQLSSSSFSPQSL